MNKLNRVALARIAVGVLGLALFGVLMWAVGAGNFSQESEVLWTLPWGKQAIADLYGGFILLTVFILIVERNWLKALLWSAPLYVLGNVWAAAWLTYRLPDIIRRLRGGAS